MKLKKAKNRLDEMQEQKMLQIEHNGCWLAFWGLAVALVAQWCMGVDRKSVAGEWIVFMCLSLYITIACARNGIWDRRLSPSPKTNLCASLLAGIISGAIYFATSYYEYHAFLGSAATGLFIMGMTVAACYAGLSIAMSFYRKRVDKLEAEEEEQEEQK